MIIQYWKMAKIMSFDLWLNDLSLVKRARSVEIKCHRKNGWTLIYSVFLSARIALLCFLFSCCWSLICEISPLCPPFPEFFSFHYCYERFPWRNSSSLEFPWVPLINVHKKNVEHSSSLFLVFINISFSTSAFILNLFEYFPETFSPSRF